MRSRMYLLHRTKIQEYLVEKNELSLEKLKIV
jgi:hypothetical protein